MDTVGTHADLPLHSFSLPFIEGLLLKTYYVLRLVPDPRDRDGESSLLAFNAHDLEERCM